MIQTAADVIPKSMINEKAAMNKKMKCSNNKLNNSLTRFNKYKKAT